MSEQPSLSPPDRDVRQTDAPPHPDAPADVSKPHRGIPIGIAIGVALVLLIGGLLVWRAESKTDKVALASSPKPVTVIHAPASPYRAERVYVGTLRPWIEASIGPQFISAYVDTVLVRPGAVVTRGSVLATLDCRKRQRADAGARLAGAGHRCAPGRHLARAARTASLLDGGFVSPTRRSKRTRRAPPPPPTSPPPRRASPRAPST